MSFKAVVIADTHLTTVNKYGINLPEGKNSRLEDNLEGIRESVQHAIDNKADYWIHLGDVFHSINPSEKLRQAFFECIRPLLGKIPVIILVGNHDTNLKDVHSLMTEHDLLDNIKPGLFRVISEPTAVKLKNTPVLLLPWAEEDELVKCIKSCKGAVIFGHLTIKGAQPSGTEFTLKEGLTPAIFNKHRMAFLGHYHKPQGASKWLYLGSSYKLSMGERDQVKRFMELNVTDDEVDYSFHQIDARPFVQQTITPDSELLITEDKACVKLTYEGPKTWVYSHNFKSIKKQLLNDGAHKVIIDTKIVRSQQERGNQLQYEPGTTWDKIVNKFAEKKGKPEYAEFANKLFRGDIEA